MRPIVTQRGLSVCHSSEPCKNGWTDRDAVWVEDSGGQENHVLDGGPDHEWGEEIFFLGGRGNPSYSIGPLSCELWKNGWTDRYALWVEDLDGPKESHIIWGPDPPMGRGNFEGERVPCVKYRDLLPWAVQKRWSDRLAVWVGDSGGPKEARVQAYSPCGASVHKFSRFRQVAPMCSHGRAHWRNLANIRLNHPSAAPMQPYVILHWPLVMLSYDVCIVLYCCLQCIDTVGWASGRAFSL